MKKNILQKDSLPSYSLWLDHRAQQFIRKSLYYYKRLNGFNFMLDPVVKPQEISSESIAYRYTKKAMLYFCVLFIQNPNSSQAATIAKPVKPVIAAPKATQAKAPSAKASSITTFNNHEALSAFAAIDFPLSSIKDPFTQNIFKSIDTVFAKSLYPLDDYQISTIKKTYLYLIFLAKLEKIKTVASLSQYKIDFLPFLKDNNTQLPHLPSEKLVKSKGWSAVSITSQDIASSQAWQLFCMSMVCDVYVYYSVVLQMIHNVEKQTFNYIPHIETSFYNADYTSLRTINELTRIKLILEDHVKKYFLDQCPAWKLLQDPKPAAKTIATGTTAPTKDPLALEKEVVAFRQTPFYKTSHDMHIMTGAPTTQILSSATSSSLMSGPIFTSPLKEQIWCYLMLYEVYGQLTTHMKAHNIQELLTAWSDTDLPVNVFPYNQDDFVLLDEIIAIKSKTEGTHTKSIHPSPANFKIEDIRPAEQLPSSGRSYERFAQEQVAKRTNSQVQAQWFGSDWGHDISSAFDDIKNGVEEAIDVTVDVAKSAGQGLVGLGAIAIGGISNDSSISKWGTDETNDAENDLTKASSDLAASVTDFGDALETGIVAPFAEVTGNLVGFILDDQKIGSDMTTVINKTVDTLVNVQEEITVTLPAQLTIVAAQAALRRVQLTVEFANTLAAAAVVVFTGGKDGKNRFIKDSMGAINTTVSAITQTMSGLMSAGEGALTIIMTGLGAIVNSLTTVFIDIVRECTYLVLSGNILSLAFGGPLGMVAGEYILPGSKFAKQARDHVSNTLNAHRQTINQVMGVAVSIAADAAIMVCTAGAGTGAAVALDASIMGAATVAAETGAEVGGTVALEAGGEALAEGAATTLATTTAETTAEEAATIAAKQLAKETIEDISKQATEDAAKQLSKKVAKEAVEDALKQATKKAGKELTEDEIKQVTKQALEDAAKKAARQAAKKASEDAVSDALKQEAKALGRKLTKEEIETVTKQALKKETEEAVEAALKQAAKKQIGALTKEETEQITKTVIENAAKQDVKTAAKDAAKQAVDKALAAARQAGKKLSQDELKQISEQAAEDALKQDGKQLTKEELEQVSKEAAEDSVKQAAKDVSSEISGKAIGMIMNIGFGLFNVVGGYNQDQQAILQELSQAKALRALWRFINETKLSTAHQQSAFLEELKYKQQAEIGNQTIALSLYQNQTNTSVDGLQKQIASSMGPLYVQLLTPDSTTNLLPADIGSSWGINTNYLDLYPSQGFFTATTGNSDFPFAQEVAQSPMLASLSSKASKKTTPDKLWFNQRSISIDAQHANNTIKLPLDPLSIAIDLQFIYTLNSEFHVGIYLGGNYDNYNSPNYLARLLSTTVANVSTALATLQTYLIAGKTIPSSLINASLIDLDAAHLAKMVVLYRDSATDLLSIGAYEHEGLKWIFQQPLPSALQLDKQHTYHLKTTLNGTSLTVELFVDKNTVATIQKTLTVTTLENQRTYGIICSGAAIMWNQITPSSQLIPNGAARPNANAQSEIDREKQAKTQLANALNPKFGLMTLKPISKQGILFGQYMYATIDTDIKKMNPASLGDFVVFASNQNGIISNIGQNPSQALLPGATLALVSLITGTVYDSTGNSVATVNNAWSTYQASSGPFSPKIGAYISTQQATITKLLSKINFGKFALDIIDSQALSSGQYIYTSTETINAKDSSGKELIDYLIMAEIADKALGSSIGMAPTSLKAQGILSLVTGNLYAKQTVFTKNETPKPLTQYNSSAQFGSYANQYNISQANQTIITTAQTAYDNYLTAKAAPKPTAIMPIIQIIPISQASTQSMSGLHLPLSGFKIGSSNGAPGVHLGLGKGSIANRQQQAAGSSGFQFVQPTGIHLKL